MKPPFIKNNRIVITIGAFVWTLTFILGEYFGDGVITHHLLARDDMPGVSNWWGLLSIPLLTLIVIHLILKRQNKNVRNDQIEPNTQSDILKHFFGAFTFGILLSIFWELGMEHILQYLILLPIAISFFRPVHFPECLLGFALGMIYTFGGILPIIIGMVLLVLCFFVNKVIRWGMVILVSKFT